MNRLLSLSFLTIALSSCGGDEAVETIDMAPDARFEQRTDMSSSSDMGEPEDTRTSADSADPSDQGACNLTIGHTPAAQAQIDTAIPFSAQITPTPDAVTLHWRRGADPDFTSTSMAGQAGVWTATLDRSAASFAGIDYWIEATLGDCVATSPELNPTDTPHHISVYGELRLTPPTADYEYRPDVWEHRVVYAIERGNGFSDDVMLVDLDTLQTQNLTDNARPQGPPRIFGRNVVYPTGAADRDIALFDLETQTEHILTDAVDDQYSVEIDGHVVVWTHAQNAGTDIYGYDLGPDGIFDTVDDLGEIELVRRGRDQRSPSVSVAADGAIRVVYASMWDDADGVCDASCDWNIYMVDFGADRLWGTADDIGPVQLTSEPNEQTGPVISGTRVAWLDARGGNWLDPDIWFLDLGPDGLFGTADDTAAQELAQPVNDPDALALWGDKLVWHDYRTSGYEVYRWDFATAMEQQITDAPSGQFYAEVWDNVIVWQDTRNNPDMEFIDDIYVRVLPEL